MTTNDTAGVSGNEAESFRHVSKHCTSPIGTCHLRPSPRREKARYAADGTQDEAGVPSMGNDPTPTKADEARKSPKTLITCATGRVAPRRSAELRGTSWMRPVHSSRQPLLPQLG